MKILGIESSALVAGVALMEDGVLLGEIYRADGLTHSETLLPEIDHLLVSHKTEVKDLDGIAISRGPGSFTGIRIGAGTAKGLAFAYNTPVLPVSSLEALAETHCPYPGPVIPLFDARREEVYAAAYRFEKGVKEELLEEGALRLRDFLQELSIKMKAYPKDAPPLFLGDGALRYEEKIREYMMEFTGGDCLFGRRDQILQRASTVCVLGERMLKEGKSVSAEEFRPTYLRRPQAIHENLERYKAASPQIRIETEC